MTVLEATCVERILQLAAHKNLLGELWNILVPTFHPQLMKSESLGGGTQVLGFF